MASLAIVGAKRVVTSRTMANESEAAVVVCRNGRIEKVGLAKFVSIPSDAERFDAEGLTLLPGFIDVHVHGGGGADTMDATPDALRAICRTHAMHGTTGLLATTITQSRDAIDAALANARSAVEAGPDFCPDGAQVLGIHLEGPYISPQKPGAQPKEYVRDYDAAEFANWLTLAGGTMRLITLAPEQPGADDLIAACRDAHIIVSLGHTDADAATTERALRLGASHATHLFNAMPPIHHRNPGPIPTLLTDYRVEGVEIIADGHHVAPEIARLVLAARSHSHVVLITDAMRGAGMGDGIYDLGGHAVTVADGRALLPDGTLAGSVLTMRDAIANVLRWHEGHFDLSVPQDPWLIIAQLTSRNAANEMHWAHKGRLKTGADADMVLVDDDLNVHATFVAGRCVYRRG